MEIKEYDQKTFENIKERKNIIRTDKLEKIAEYILYLFLISLCCFKGMINTFGGLFVLTSGILIYKIPNKKEFFKKYKMELIFTGIYFLGIIFEWFSIDNAKAYKFLYKNFYFLMAPGILYFFEKEEIRKKAVYLISFSLFIGIIESFRQFAVIHKYIYNSTIRVESFFDCMRWGSALQMALLLILPFLKKNIYFWGVFLLGIPSLILNNSRGPWVGFTVCFCIYMAYLLFYKKKVKTILCIALLGGVIAVGGAVRHRDLASKIITRVATIKNTENNYSNLGRLYMWKENILFMKDSLRNNKRAFFFGVGCDNRTTIEDYITKKDSWKNAPARLKGSTSFTDAHNMYIHTFVRKGFIYGFLFWGYMLVYILKKLKDGLYLEDEYILGSFLSTISFFICGIFYGYIFTFDTFIFYIIFLLGVNYKYEIFSYKNKIEGGRK